MNPKRGKTPSLLTGSSGKPAKVTAKRCRKCCRCAFMVSNGEVCFEVPKVGGGFSSKKTYCSNCFKEILEQTKKDIAIFDEYFSEEES
jgi:ribosomal protein L37E